MPELPEAEAQRRLLDRCVVGQTIERVETKEQGGGARDGQLDDKVLDGDIDALAGAHVAAAKRKGKQLWLELDKGKTKHCLLIHLGMTGSCVIKGEAPPSYKAFSIDDAFPPKYTKLELVMDDGTRLAYCDPRRFGRIKLRGAEPEELAALAPDALEAPAVAAMRSALSSKSAPIKAVLLDQSAVVCGIGNWVADEVLYMSRIHPATAAAAPGKVPYDVGCGSLVCLQIIAQRGTRQGSGGEDRGGAPIHRPPGPAHHSAAVRRDGVARDVRARLRRARGRRAQP